MKVPVGLAPSSLMKRPGVALAVDERGPAFAESDGGYVGKDAGVTPHAEAGGSGGSTGGDLFPLRGFLELIHVIAHIEGASTERADGLRGFGRDAMVTAGTLKKSNNGHILDATGIGAMGVVPAWLNFDHRESRQRTVRIASGF